MESAKVRSKELFDATPRCGRSPLQIDSEKTWWSILESLPHLFPRLIKRPEYRYPLLDKDLVEFLVRVPRAQLMKPGRRRFMMRRALKSIVPEEILERKQKAFQLRAPLVKLQQSQALLRRVFKDSMLAQMGCIDVGQFFQTLERASLGEMTYWFAVQQTIALELWLQSSRVVLPVVRSNAVSSLAAYDAA